jgi:hypothetical protein
LLPTNITASIPQQLIDEISNPTNLAGTFGYLTDTSFNRKGYFVDVVYSLTDHAGLIFGYDYMTGGGKSELNSVRGGLSLKASMYPLKNWGYTNLLVTPFVADMVATGRAGDIGNVVATGINIRIYSWSKLELGSVLFYEKRMGQSEYSGNYGGIGVVLRYHPKAP